MSRIRRDGATIGVLWTRDVTLFFRQKSRILGSLVPPILLWLAIGAGVAPAFHMKGADVGYMEYFFPGIVFMVVLQVSISATMSVIEDRRQGFLQGVLVAPGSRASLVLGKSFGATTVGFFHALVFLALAPAAGFSLVGVDWAFLALVLGLGTLALTATGFALAWWLDSVQGYHVIMSVILFPSWMLSGAFFPVEGQHPVMATIVRCNPMSYAVAGIRRALYGGSLPAGIGLPGSSPALEAAVVTAMALATLAFASWTCARRPGD